MRLRYTVIPILAATFLTCARARSPGFPPPVRPGVLVPSGFQTAFASLTSLIESRGIPVLLADTAFGTLRTDWVYWAPGEVDLASVATCDLEGDTPPVRTRARFAFEVRRRANRASVLILTQWQAEAHGGFDASDRGFVDCRSTGEWERMVEQTLLQRTTIR